MSADRFSQGDTVLPRKGGPRSPMLVVAVSEMGEHQAVTILIDGGRREYPAWDLVKATEPRPLAVVYAGGRRR